MTPHAPMPELLEEVAAIAGVEEALRLARDFGGTKIYLPAQPGPDHPLSRCLGHAAACAVAHGIAGARTGLHLLIPMGPSSSQATRWRKMHVLIDKGLAKREIARACGVHERTVQMHRNRLTQNGGNARASLQRVNAALAQLPLFPD